MDLSVDLGGIQLGNPLIVASGDIGCYVRQVKEAESYGAGGFIIKTCLPRREAIGLQRKPRFYADLKKGTLNAVAGFHRISLDEAKALVSDARKEVRIPVGASVAVGLPAEEEIIIAVKAAKELCESGASFIELNLSSNLPIHYSEAHAADNGKCFTEAKAAQYPAFMHEVVKSVKGAVDVPVIAKITLENLNIDALIEAIETGGANAIDIMNAGPGMPLDIDIYNAPAFGRVFQSADKATFLGLTGEPLRRIMQAYVIRCARSRQIPILACGGIMNWQHACETIMCGATAVSGCTVFMLRGFEVLKQMEEGIRTFMKEQAYGFVDEFRGILVDKIALTLDEITVSDAVARVDPEKCNGCGLCTKPAHCGRTNRAINLVDGKASVDEIQCLGCETCVSICPVNAITMVIKG
jgi:dihydropyrimidine dehydrogenase (NAD+) subunit PreA